MGSWREHKLPGTKSAKRPTSLLRQPATPTKPGITKTRTTLLAGIALAVGTFTAWRLLAPRSAETAPELRALSADPSTPGAVEPVVPAEPAQPPAPPPLPAPSELPWAGTELNERTLAGTRWAREGFALEFGENGRLLIGGEDRARWRIEGRRVHLYHETTGEEHWLDIAGDKLMWEGHEVSRVP